MDEVDGRLAKPGAAPPASPVVLWMSSSAGAGGTAVAILATEGYVLVSSCHRRDFDREGQFTPSKRYPFVLPAPPLALFTTLQYAEYNGINIRRTSLSF